MNIFKKLFLILRNINNKIKDFEESIEKLKKDSQENTENKMIEVERKFEKMFIECKNKKTLQICTIQLILFLEN